MTVTDELKKVYKDCFSQDSDAYIDYFFSKLNSDDAIFLRENEKIISAAYICPKNAVIFGKKQQIGYISAASTLPEFRGKRKIVTVMHDAIKTLYNRDFGFAALNPFDYNYYKQYGFVNVSFCKKKIISGENVLGMREANKKDVKIMARLANSMNKNFDSYIVCDNKKIKEQFNEFNADNIKAYIISKGKEPIAYFFDEDEEINCYATSNMQEFLGCKNIAGKSVNDFFCMNEPFIQMRVINVAKALNSCDFSNFGDMVKTVTIKDNIIKDNNLCIKIKVTGGKQVITRAYSADVLIDISVLTKQLFNYSRNFFADRY